MTSKRRKTMRGKTKPPDRDTRVYAHGESSRILDESWELVTPVYKTKAGAKRALERVAAKLGFEVEWEDD